MSENEDTRMILHRVVFYDLLSTPAIESQRYTYGKIHESHLSIPMMPGLETVWAPNGYGKTFAMQMLERMWKPTEYSSDEWTIRGGVHWLSDFLRECQAMVLDISKSLSSEKIRESSFHEISTLSQYDWTPEGVQRMVPFSLMMARIVELDKSDQILEVHDLWIKPNWRNFVTHDIEVEVGRIPMFASYELIFSELLSDDEFHDKYLLEKLNYLDEEAKFFIMERGSWEKESSILQKAGLDLSKFIEENENEYWNPVIPTTFNWNSEPDLIDSLVSDNAGPPGTDEFSAVEPYQSGYLDDDGEWKSGDSTKDRRPPVPFEIAHGTSINFDMSGKTRDLLEVLRSTKIDYVEIPKKSLEFFEDPEETTQKVTEITSTLMASNVRKIENNINDVLRMKGDTDPWSRKVSLLGSMSLSKYRRGAKVWGTQVSHLANLEEMLITNSKLLPRDLQLDIESLGLPSKFEAGRIHVVVPNNNRILSWSIENVQFNIQLFNEAISDWKEVVQSYEDNLARTINQESEKLIILHENLEQNKRELELELYELKEAADRAAENEDISSEIMEKIQFLVYRLRDVNRELSVRKESVEEQLSTGNKIIKENLRTSLEIVDTLRLCLSFYEDAYTILELFDDSLSDQDDTVNFIDFQLAKLDKSALRYKHRELPKLREYSLPKSRGSNERDMLREFTLKLKRMKKHIDESGELNFEVESPFRNSALRKEVLSFGQKSTILTELYLGTFEALSQSTDDGDELNSDNRYCLIIDEPEVGRSEYSIDLLIKRLQSSKNIHDNEMQNSVVVLSHRNKLLKQVSGKYHLLQPVDIGYQTEEE